jgi:hypothetical protein
VLRWGSSNVVLDFLEEPAVAVRVAERAVRPIVRPLRVHPGRLALRPEPERLADLQPAPDELGTRGLDVIDDKFSLASWSTSRVNPMVSR